MRFKLKKSISNVTKLRYRRTSGYKYENRGEKKIIITKTATEKFVVDKCMLLSYLLSFISFLFSMCMYSIFTEHMDLKVLNGT